MEQELPTGPKRRWERTASGFCLLACWVFFYLNYREAGESTVVICSILSGFGIVLAISAIRQRCAKRVNAWIYLVLLSLPPLILSVMVLLSENFRTQIRYFWRDFFGY